MMSKSEEMLPSTATLRPLEVCSSNFNLETRSTNFVSAESGISTSLSPSDSAKGPKNSTLTIIALPPGWAGASMYALAGSQQSIHRLRTIVNKYEALGVCMKRTMAVVFDCDGVLADNGSSWKNIHTKFGTDSEDGSHKKTLEMFLDGKITEEEFVEHDIRLWKSVKSDIHRDDIMKCYSGVGLMKGARDVVEELQNRGIYVAIVSSGVDLFVGAIANMLKVDDWAANGFEWDEDGFLQRGLPTRVYSHDKGLMVDKLVRINGFDTSGIVSVGDSSTDLSMKIGESSFIGFNPARERALSSFLESGVPVVESKDLRDIWPHIFDGEEFPKAN